jgi:[ribosomal protein S5]-alanine N-acetyltransferase
MPSIPQLAEPLTDGHVRLRMAAERDIPEILIAYQDDPRLHVRLGEDRPPSGAQLGSRSERAADELEEGTRIHLTITEPEADDCRGQLSAQHFDWHHMRAEVGIWVAPQLRGRGVARHALRLAAGWLFESCALERLALLTDLDNEPMLRAAESAGFVREGVLRSYARERGQRVNSAILSLLPEDLRR